MKDKIYDSLLALTISKSIGDITIRDISSHSSVSIGSIYYNFKDKEQIINQLYLKTKMKLNNHVISNDPSSLRKLIDSYLDFSFENKNKYKFITSEDIKHVLTDDTKEQINYVYDKVIEFLTTDNKEVINLIIIGSLNNYILEYDKRDCNVEQIMLTYFKKC